MLECCFVEFTESLKSHCVVNAGGSMDGRPTALRSASAVHRVQGHLGVGVAHTTSSLSGLVRYAWLRGRRYARTDAAAKNEPPKARWPLRRPHARVMSHKSHGCIL